MSTLEPRVIKTDEQHEAFLAEVERLASLDPDPESPQGLRLELLAMLIESYEKVRYAFAKPDPVEALVFRMQQQGLRQKDIAPLLGGKNRASEVLARKRPLTLPMIRALHGELDIPPDLLIREPAAKYKVGRKARHEETTAHGTFKLEGFEGFVPMRDVSNSLSLIPSSPGIYIVIRGGRGRARFHVKSPAGRFKGRDPTCPVGKLEEKWVPDATVLYVGKAGPSASRSLKRRIRELVQFGAGKPVAHWGGRALWQLEGIWDAAIAWKTTSGDPRRAEHQMIKEFVKRFGSLPFGNLQS